MGFIKGVAYTVVTVVAIRIALEATERAIQSYNTYQAEKYGR